jgi:hypothetical protein
MEARESANDSKRSADAAERSAAAVERAVALAEAEAGKPPWEVKRVDHSKYHLINGSNYPVYRVSVAASFVIESPVTRDRVGPDEAVDFFVAIASGEPDDSITVHWYPLPDQAGDPEVWRYPIP